MFVEIDIYDFLQE